MFSHGQRVLCIKGGWGSKTGSQHQLAFCPNVPRRGVIYTIRTCQQTSNGSWWVRLNEIRNPSVGTWPEPHFEGPNFVPIKRVDTDISFAHAILARTTRARSITTKPRRKAKA